jgi:hypothetical protein
VKAIQYRTTKRGKQQLHALQDNLRASLEAKSNWAKKHESSGFANQAKQAKPLLTPKTSAIVATLFHLISNTGVIKPEGKICSAHHHVPPRQQDAKVAATQGVFASTFMADPNAVMHPVKPGTDPQALAYAAKPHPNIGMLKAFTQLRKGHDGHKLSRRHTDQHSNSNENQIAQDIVQQMISVIAPHRHLAL